MSNFLEITNSIKKMYYKRLDKNIDEETFDKWFERLKDFWNKNKDLLHFIENLHLESKKKKDISIGLIPYCIELAKEFEERETLFGKEEALNQFLCKYEITENEIKKYLKVKTILEEFE